MFSAFITKVVAAILKKAAVLGGLRWLADAFTIYSWFETARSIHECKDVTSCVVEVAYDIVTDQAVDELVNRVVDNRFDVRQTSSGLYVASNKPVLQPSLVYPRIDLWQAHGFSSAFAATWQQAGDAFSGSLSEKRAGFLRELELKRRQRDGR